MNEKNAKGMKINQTKTNNNNHILEYSSYKIIKVEQSLYNFKRKKLIKSYFKTIKFIKTFSKLIILYIFLIIINFPKYKKIPKRYTLLKKRMSNYTKAFINNNINIALCTMGKEENLYLNEFIDYYINIGVNHIFIYDDNPPNIEKLSNIISNKYKQNVTIYENITNIIKDQSMAFNDCYQKNKNIYDWFLMVDMDEFLYLVEDNSLKEYLSNKIFDKCDFIQFNWALSTDNNLIYYDNRTLFERFKPPYLKDKFVKSMIRGNISELKYWVHSPYSSPLRNISCINTGDMIIKNNINIESIKPINIEKAFLIHFRFKSTEELIKKFKRGYSNWFRNKIKDFLKGNLEDYFEQNKITLEKIKYIEKELKVNLLYFKIRYYFCKIFFFDKIC